MKKRNGSVDFWKFVFSFVIMTFHSLYFAGDVQYPFYNGANMVEFFFLVSGFLMAASLMKYDTGQVPVWKNTWKFLIHKIKGFCPDYYVAWAIAFFVKNAAGGLLPLRKVAKHGFLCIWELCFVRMAGFNDYNANGATWYISAMLVSMLVLVPLFLYRKEAFLYIIAPVAGIGVLGYLYATGKVLRGNTDWLGFCYKGLLRAAGGICIGCICYVACQKIKDVAFTNLAKCLLSAAELGGYLFALYWSYGHGSSKMEFIIMFLFAVSITISFSHQGLLAPIFDNRAVYWLGTFSLPLFLAHHAWSGRVARIFPQETYAGLLPRYYMLSLATAFAIYFISALLKKLYGKYGQAWKRLFVRA